MYSLETSSHILQLFAVPGDPYYALIDRSRPTDYSINPLSSTSCFITTEANDNEISIFLNNIPIGQISTTNPSPLADFLTFWRQAISTLPNVSTSVITNKNQLRHLIPSSLTSLNNTILNTLDPSSYVSSEESPASKVEALKTNLVTNIAPLIPTFVNKCPLTFRFITWNIHAEPISKTNISSLLGLPDKRYDMYVLALQESDELGPKNLYANHTTLESTKEYLVQTLGGPKDYEVVAWNQLLGIMMIVVVNTKLSPHLSNFSMATTATGLLGLWGNKGAAMVSFYIGQDLTLGISGTKISILNCHLTHGESFQSTDRRRWELSEIQRKLNIPGLVGSPQTVVLFNNNKDDDALSLSTKNDSKPDLSATSSVDDLGTTKHVSMESLSLKSEKIDEESEDDDNIIFHSDDESSDSGKTEREPSEEKKDEQKKDESTNNSKDEKKDEKDEKDDEKKEDKQEEKKEEDMTISVLPSRTPIASAIKSPKPDDRLIFVVGDFNYRVNLDPDVVVNLAEHNDFETIVAQDRLLLERAQQSVLSDYEEGEINFPPTYKYSIGTDDYDDTKLPAEDKKMKARTPSYTDRIFFSRNEGLKLEKYTSLMEYTLSDHKPVVADFVYDASLIDEEKRKDAISKVLKESDDKENMSKPNIIVSPRDVVVKDAIVMKESEAVISIEHVPSATNPDQEKVLYWELSLAPATNNNSTTSLVSNEEEEGTEKHSEVQDSNLLFKDIQKNVQDDSSLTIYPTRGALPPVAKQYIHIKCTLPIQRGISRLSRVAVLRIVDTQDIFIPIEFVSLPTCLGTSLEVLSRFKGGARKGAQAMLDDASNNMPKEIWSCVDYVWQHIDLLPHRSQYKRGKEDGLFTENTPKYAEASLKFQIQEWLDNDEEFDTVVLDTANQLMSGIPVGVYSVLDQFLLFLRHLDGKIIPYEYYSTIVLKGRMGANLILERIPRANVNVLLYLMSFLKLLIDEEKIYPDPLLAFFDPLIIQQPTVVRDSRANKYARMEFLKELVGI